MKRTRRNHAIDPVWLDYFDPHNLLVGAARYYMSARSICSIGFAEELAAAWPDIPQHTRKAIQNDLEREFRMDPGIGHPWSDVDRTAWDKVRQAWEAMQ